MTNRFYCSQCFEPTIEEQFRLANQDYIPPEDEYENMPEEYQPEESTPKWTEEDENDFDIF